MADKIDFKKALDSYRAKAGEFRVLDIAPRNYLMIDGHGDPNTSPAYADAIAALYPVAYALKFASKLDLGRDYVVPPLEGLWWAADLASFTTERNKANWDWTLLLFVPDWLGEAHLEQAVERVAAKGDAPARLAEVRLESLAEGRCVQTLHLGSFDDEAAVLAELHDEFIPSQGYRLSGKHHEIYLSDFRKVSADRLRTILRQPVLPVAGEVR